MIVSVDGSQYILDMIENIDFPLEIQIKYNFKDNDSNIRQVRKLKDDFQMIRICGVVLLSLTPIQKRSI